MWLSSVLFITTLSLQNSEQRVHNAEFRSVETVHHSAREIELVAGDFLAVDAEHCQHFLQKNNSLSQHECSKLSRLMIYILLI